MAGLLRFIVDEDTSLMINIQEIKFNQNNLKQHCQKFGHLRDMRELARSRVRKIGLYLVLLWQSERESNSDIFGGVSECETIRFPISLLCLICNISPFHESGHLVVVSIQRSSGRTDPGAVWVLVSSAA